MRRRLVEQARLMLRVLQHVSREPCFALKGGTAINFFVRDMPRLSVDIDLTYLPLKPRPDSLKEIGEAREELIRLLLRDLSDKERRFAISIKAAKPEWRLLGIEGIDKLPGIQWKLRNIKRMPVDKHRKQLGYLKKVLGL